MNKEMEAQIRRTVEKNPDMEVALNKKAEKFYFYSAGGWISASELFKKVNPNWRKDNKSLLELEEELKTNLVLLLATGKAISKVEEDNVTRYKFTQKSEVHLKFLEEEEKFLVERLNWIREKKKFFLDKKQ